MWMPFRAVCFQVMVLRSILFIPCYLVFPEPLAYCLHWCGTVFTVCRSKGRHPIPWSGFRRRWVSKVDLVFTKNCAPLHFFKCEGFLFGDSVIFRIYWLTRLGGLFVKIIPE